MSPTKVVVLDHTAQRGGAEIALQRLLVSLSDDWDVTVVLFDEGPFRASLESAGIRVEVVPLPERTAGQARGGLTDPRVLLRSGADSLAFARTLADRIGAIGASLVVANSLKAAVLAEVSSWRTKLPWVWHLHDRLAPDYLPRPVVTGMRQLARRARHVVANSRAVAELTRLPPARVSIAYPGLPDDAYTNLHASPTPPVFGLLGRISSTKGQREFIEAAAIVNQAHPQARFRIVGDALFSDQPYAADVRALPERLGLGDRVEFAGWAADPAAAIDDFSVLVHASPVPEPFGQVIVEAMARRVPVIATLGGGVGEILDGPTAALPPGSFATTRFGRLVRAGDPRSLANAMQAAMADGTLTELLADRAHARAQGEFSIKVTAGVVQSVWQAAADRQR